MCSNCSDSEYRETIEADARARRRVRTYCGVRNAYGCEVFVKGDTHSGRPLPWRLNLVNHSPTGLSWGYGGSGPAQLALAILADYLGDDQRARQLHQDFKWKVIASLPHEGWELTERQIEDAITEITVERLQAS